MWKVITRGIRESIERRVCRTNVYSQPATTDECNGSETKPSLNVKQSCLSTSHRYTSGFCRFFNQQGTKDKKTHTGWTTEKTFSDIIGWSSIVAVGWAICQTPCIRKRIFDRNRNEKWPQHILKCPRRQVSHFVTHALTVQPTHVLPVTNCVGNTRRFSDDTDGNEQGKEYGPITVEEALEAARDEYSRTHKVVMGEYEFRYGIKALDEKRYHDAIKHFLLGAQLNSPGSMFNLGLCYELGIGTRTDPVKAVKYYQNAAKNGHADAMYNLGVFYAQGKGGLSINLNQARELFTKAASLGQQEAQAALKLDRDMNEKRNRNKVNEATSLDNSTPKSSDFYAYLDEQPLARVTLDYNYDELHNRKCIRSSPDNFLNFLGIQSNQLLLQPAK